jgi:hypothetical protein
MSILSADEMWGAHLKYCRQCQGFKRCQIGEVYFKLILHKLSLDFIDSKKNNGAFSMSSRGAATG